MESAVGADLGSVYLLPDGFQRNAPTSRYIGIQISLQSLLDCVCFETIRMYASDLTDGCCACGWTQLSQTIPNVGIRFSVLTPGIRRGPRLLSWKKKKLSFSAPQHKCLFFFFSSKVSNHYFLLNTPESIPCDRMKPSLVDLWSLQQ